MSQLWDSAERGLRSHPGTGSAPGLELPSKEGSDKAPWLKGKHQSQGSYRKKL